LHKGGKASVHVSRSAPFLRREVHAGRLRAVRIGGRRELFTRAEWLDDWMLAHEQPVAIAPRRRGGAA
jgi:hypothetical protein